MDFVTPRVEIYQGTWKRSLFKNVTFSHF